jgi:hypothetical protein
MMFTQRSLEQEVILVSNSILFLKNWWTLKHVYRNEYIYTAFHTIKDRGSNHHTLPALQQWLALHFLSVQQA